MTDTPSREIQEPTPGEDRRYRALASAVHFLDAARRELPALARRVRGEGVEASPKDLDHLIDGLGSVLRLVIELDSAAGGRISQRRSALGGLPRALRDLAAARRASDAAQLADLLEKLPADIYSCRHVVGARLEALAHERRA